MKNTSWLPLLAAAVCIIPQSLWAQGQPLDMSPIPTPWLASNDLNGTTSSVSFDSKETSSSDATFEAPLFSGNKVHQYLGIGALGLLALAIVSPKGENGPHEYFATGSAVLGTAAATTGLIYHWDDFDFDDGLSDPDNLHMLLGSTGALLMLAAISQAPEGGHPALGIAGGVAMGVAVKLTW
jgi:hypothetical protein